MTAKEALREAIEDMSEDEAARWLREIAEARPDGAVQPRPGSLLELNVRLRRVFADVPDDAWDPMPRDYVDAELTADLDRMFPGLREAT